MSATWPSQTLSTTWLGTGWANPRNYIVPGVDDHRKSLGAEYSASETIDFSYVAKNAVPKLMPGTSTQAKHHLTRPPFSRVEMRGFAEADLGPSAKQCKSRPCEALCLETLLRQCQERTQFCIYQFLRKGRNEDCTSAAIQPVPYGLLR